MSEENPNQVRFFGTYFEADSVMTLARWSIVLSWIVLVIYLLVFLVAVIQVVLQFASGMFGDKGMVVLNLLNIFLPFLTQPLPGVFYFFGLQAIGKGLLIFMDVEANTRRAASRK